MSVLDSLTDEGLRKLVESKNHQIAFLQARIMFLEEEHSRLDRQIRAKSQRIVGLSLDLVEMRRPKCGK